VQNDHASAGTGAGEGAQPVGFASVTTQVSAAATSIMADEQTRDAAPEARQAMHEVTMSIAAGSDLAADTFCLATSPSTPKMPVVQVMTTPSTPGGGSLVGLPVSSSPRTSRSSSHGDLVEPTCETYQSAVPGGFMPADIMEAACIPSQADVIAYGGILESNGAGQRSSGRLQAQPNVDATQMERAMALAQRRDNMMAQGTNLNNKFSILSFSNDEIINRASRIGVFLGETDVARRASAQIIKDNEMHRSLVILKKKEQNNIGEDGGPHNLLVSRVSNLCDDLVDEESPTCDDHLELVVPCEKVVKSRVRKTYDKTNVRRSTRVKIKKNCS
jgi:hypothetical protein